MGFLSFTRKRKTSEHPGQSPPKRSFSSFSLRPRSFFDSNEPPTKLEPAVPRPRQRATARDTRERAALLHDLNANYFSQSLPSGTRGNRGATFHPGASGGGMDWRLGATAAEATGAEAEEASRGEFAAFMARNGLDSDEDSEEELLPPPTRRAPRADGRPIGLGEFGRHSMFDAPCAPVEPLSKVPTNASLVLPPGAMHPTPPRIDFAAEVFRPIDWGFKKRNAAMVSYYI
ncbi:hypothetical protein A1Q1_05614 [Trichosporon asahii var. asahii CBS 2479]|uniref:Uncharacterized protein n=1 Tax=Trichosporon asahii var. asahii (strain ATCC 90039 / CBS 2479 / JCM 2466 / KCTC 7840 / NBRC 103889/ NCYC 2677 / UAMH 7654) TaxID=1186058 RepID=J6ET55_TRIAS|nr:hypothetical protein A1Q1_05614 [Trichosporon asahii var. asahii CBS 2479]EJT45942.1 hypothetical protein A1Q1_05614 [Trichosporon asahii var. asahii CBS 2479]